MLQLKAGGAKSLALVCNALNAANLRWLYPAQSYFDNLWLGKTGDSHHLRISVDLEARSFFLQTFDRINLHEKCQVQTLSLF